MAKCLYLAKRTRPDILTPVAFLSTRVQKATSDDWKKLERVYKYLRGTKELGIVLEPDNHLSVFAYIDASYGVYGDYKSHTGMVVGVYRQRPDVREEFEAAHCYQEQYGRRACRTQRRDQPGGVDSEFSHRTGIRARSSDGVPGQPVHHGTGESGQVYVGAHETHRDQVLLHCGSSEGR